VVIQARSEGTRGRDGFGGAWGFSRGPFDGLSGGEVGGGYVVMDGGGALI
jgi:hypothetical protein